MLLLITADKAQRKRRRKATNVNRFDFELEYDGVLFQFHHIYGTNGVGFPGAKNQQQPQAPKPHIDAMKLIVGQNKPLEELIRLDSLQL